MISIIQLLRIIQDEKKQGKSDKRNAFCTSKLVQSNQSFNSVNEF